MHTVQDRIDGHRKSPPTDRILGWNEPAPVERWCHVLYEFLHRITSNG